MNHDDGGRVGSPNLQEILAELLSLPPHEQRERIELLGLDEQHRAELLSRIGHAARTGVGLPDEPAALLPQLGEQMRPAAAKDPELIGDYRIVRKIDEGGMGVVYEARHQRLDQRVALKLIRPGFMTPQMLRRFEYEATLLARLDHPGVARIFYAGIFDSGAGPQPYFAMEYVEGRPLDEYLKINRAKLKQRQLVELFHAICDAVQAAHAKGIVHRDLKPDNILITRDGKPKVLDFGVARAVDADSQAVTMQSETGALIGTIPYMAPEQVRGQVDEIEQPTDVYALGVIGYEIFADRMPYAVHGKPLPEAARIICEDEPSRLSSINKSLRGDVETIVQKALEKEKTRRYHTAGELAADVKRYLDYEPITARPPSTWYNLRKFAKRNKLVVSGVALLVVVLGAGAVTSTSFAIRATRQEREAKSQAEIATAVTEFLTERVLSGATPERLPDKEVRDAIVKAMLDPAAAAVARDFGGKPLTEAAVRNSLGVAYYAIGRADLGLPHSEAALSLRRRVLGDDDPNTLDSINNVGAVLQDLGRVVEAEQLLSDALRRARQTISSDHEISISLMSGVANSFISLGRTTDAEPLVREALERRRRTSGEDDEDTIDSKANLASVLILLDQTDEAEILLRDLVDRTPRLFGEDNSYTMRAISSLGALYMRTGKLDESAALRRDLLQRRSRVLGADHPLTLLAVNNLAFTLFELEKFEEAESLFRQNLTYRRRKLSNNHPDTTLAMGNLAMALDSLGRFAESEALYREARDRNLANGRDRDRYTVVWTARLANAVQQQARQTEAETLYREALQLAKRALPEGDPLISSITEMLADLYDDMNSANDAARLRADLSAATQAATSPSR